MGKGNKVEMLIAICAVITSAIAVFIAWDQGRVMRAQQHGSVYPVLQANGYTSTDPEVREIGVVFRNSGVGPALIESVDVFRGDEHVDSLISYRDALPPGYSLSWTSMVGRAIAPGETLDALRISWPVGQMSHAELDATAQEWGSLTMKICYCSVFKRCWNVEGLAQNSPAERVKSCERSEQDIFEGLSSVNQAQDDKNPELE
ncbi:hypothetical protein [uncultured Hyphomonas sp.]|uniref:hypothetical protein n=1 Tax=uncultured Hyphomonas sp. TaxID=225298 RepID=UPI002AAA8CF6|nr:hypothetical protein [uncultured Hyphomonas sp.]